MSNSNYAQVTSLLAAGRLNWTTDLIRAYLCTGASFNPAHSSAEQAGGTVLARKQVQGKSVSEDMWLGQPVFFDNVREDTSYQVLLVQELGMGKNRLLAFLDAAGIGEDAGPLTIEHYGTLVVRPELCEVIGITYGTGIWMRVAPLEEAAA